MIFSRSYRRKVVGQRRTRQQKNARKMGVSTINLRRELGYEDYRSKALFDNGRSARES